MHNKLCNKICNKIWSRPSVGRVVGSAHKQIPPPLRQVLCLMTPQPPLPVGLPPWQRSKNPLNELEENTHIPIGHPVATLKENNYTLREENPPLPDLQDASASGR